MWQFCELLLSFCLFRRGPEDMPYSKGLLLGLLLFDWGLSSTLLSAVTTFVKAALIRALLLWVMFGFIKKILQFRKLPERFVQMAISMLGVECVLIVVTALLRLMVTPTKIMIVVLSIWQLIIYISIFKKGFNLTTGKAIWVTLFYNALQSFILVNLLALLKADVLPAG